MSLLPRTTPKLTHQSRNSNRRAPSPSQTKPNVDLILHRGHKTTPEKKQIWYKRKILSSDIDETDDTEYGQSADDNGDASDSIEKTPSPRKPIQNFFDLVSTPINPDSTVSFLSPMRMLNDLHLKSQVLMMNKGVTMSLLKLPMALQRRYMNKLVKKVTSMMKTPSETRQ